jgi:beta-fructofuranosidase
LEILAVFDPGDAKAVGLNVRRSEDGSRAVTIRCDGRTLDVAGTMAPLQLGSDERTLTLHIFLDRSLMEIFANGGRECVTKVIHTEEHDLGLEVFTIGGGATVRALDVWRLKGTGE